jgi:hypothetical protein
MKNMHNSPDKTSSKPVKFAAQRGMAWFRRTFLASESFVIPTHMPYEASLAHLRRALSDSPQFSFAEEILPEDHDSAFFRIELYEEMSGTTGSAQRWRRIVLAKGRMVSQPAFGDALLTGDVFNGWWMLLQSYFYVLFGGWIVAYALNQMGQVTDDTTSTIFTLILGIVFALVGIERLFRMPQRRQQMLEALKEIFAEKPSAHD